MNKSATTAHRRDPYLSRVQRLALWTWRKSLNRHRALLCNYGSFWHF
ncbi:MAG: hypothetical protein V7641_3095 [Blastocatellia bacterium]